MRRLANAERIRRFLRELGRASQGPATVYLTGGATAVLHGWRESTIDIDIKLVPERDDLLRALQRLKEELEVNVELASPDLFLPVTDDWESASLRETTESALEVKHFDLRAQALGKVERGHDRDRVDVAAMLERQLVTREGLWAYFDAVRPGLFRFPAVDARTLEQALERTIGPRPHDAA